MKSGSRLVLSAALVAGMAYGSWAQAAGGSQGANPSQAASTSQGTPAVGPRSGETISPRGLERIAREVRHELLMLPYYTMFDNLAYRVDASTVVLMGQVTRPSLKSDAENAVKKIEGVEKVVNQIEVLPPSPMDDRIRRELARRLANTGGLWKYFMGAVPSIHIIVNSGHVSLQGVVDSEGDRTLAEVETKSVPGIFSVKNDLMVAR